MYELASHLMLRIGIECHLKLIADSRSISVIVFDLFLCKARGMSYASDFPPSCNSSLSETHIYKIPSYSP